VNASLTRIVGACVADSWSESDQNSCTRERQNARLVENRGTPGTQVTANVTIQRVGGGSAVLVPDTTFVLSDADTVFAPARLDSAGLALLLEGMNEYVDYYNSGKVGPCPSLDYTFTWSMTATPFADFTWEAKVKFTIVAVARVDVPDLWGN